MKFSEFLHKQPSIPWTNPGEVEWRSHNYFGRDRKKHFFQTIKNIKFMLVFLDVYALAHIDTGSIFG